MVAIFPRLHALCIGPGLGRNEAVFNSVSQVIEKAKKTKLPLVIDADGLILIEKKFELIRGYKECVLTPNKMEYRRLAKAVCGDENAELTALCAALDGVVILQKGPI